MRAIYQSSGRADIPVAAKDDNAARDQAIARIRRRRGFRLELIVSGLGMAILVAIWGFSEYHNAGGWPTDGFSQSSGIHEVWNFWIVYPLLAWLLIMGGRFWAVYLHKPISEDEIRQEMDRRHR